MKSKSGGKTKAVIFLCHFTCFIIKFSLRQMYNFLKKLNQPSWPIFEMPISVLQLCIELICSVTGVQQHRTALLRDPSCGRQSHGGTPCCAGCESSKLIMFQKANKHTYGRKFTSMMRCRYCLCLRIPCGQGVGWEVHGCLYSPSYFLPLGEGKMLN